MSSGILSASPGGRTGTALLRRIPPSSRFRRRSFPPWEKTTKWNVSALALISDANASEDTTARAPKKINGR
jgi:hypothetical protein